MNGHLVYVRNFENRPRPQVWQELFYGVDNALKERVVAIFDLMPEDKGLSVAELEQRYPIPPEFLDQDM
jgi:hypothetical protein